jgi:hypothetical protein
VQVAHDILIRAHQEETDVIRLKLTVAVRVQLVQGQSVFYVAEIHKLVHLTVGITSDVCQVASRVGRSFSRPMGMMGNK